MLTIQKGGPMQQSMCSICRIYQVHILDHIGWTICTVQLVDTGLTFTMIAKFTGKSHTPSIPIGSGENGAAGATGKMDMPRRMNPLMYSSGTVIST